MILNNASCFYLVEMNIINLREKPPRVRAGGEMTE